MAITLEQDVANKEMPVGTDWIFTISSTNYAGNYKFKYIADLWIDEGTPGALSIRLKFSPNSTGNGIIDISKILEQYVSSDSIGRKSKFKGTSITNDNPHSIHLIDNFSWNTDLARRLTIRWGEEYSTNATDAPTEYLNVYTSSNYLFWDGVAYEGDTRFDNGEYGLSLYDWNGKQFIIDFGVGSFLTDASADRQYIGDNEYATLGFLNGYLPTNGGNDTNEIYFNFKDSTGASLSTFTTSLSVTNGGYDGTGDSALTDSKYHILYAGVGVANLEGAGFSVPTSWAYYEVSLRNSGANESKIYHYYKRNTDCKGFEKIRLTWLNKYGVWDYYTFTKKNIRSTNIKRAEYSKIKGNWNGSTFTQHGWNRGRGVLNTSATESISLNSDWFSSDEEAAWLEQLFISSEVFILEDYDNGDVGAGGSKYGKYLTPVVVTSRSYDRYTRANDKVAQYELDIEYSINKRIQRA